MIIRVVFKNGNFWKYKNKLLEFFGEFWRVFSLINKKN